MTNRGTTRRTVLTGPAALGAAATLPLTPAGPAHAASGTTARTGAEDAAALRTRWHTLLTGGAGLDRDDARIAAATARVGRAGATAATGLDPSRTDGLFPDLTSTTLSNHVTTSFKRLATAATAWAVPGTPQHGDAALLAKLMGGVDWMLTHRYGPGHTRFDNDWDWEIGAALALNDTAVLLHDELGAERLERVTAAVLHYTPDPNLWRANRQIATGANRVWVSTVVAVNAVLRGDGDALGRVRDALSDVEGSGANSVLALQRHRRRGGRHGRGLLVRRLVPPALQAPVQRRLRQGAAGRSVPAAQPAGRYGVDGDRSRSRQRAGLGGRRLRPADVPGRCDGVGVRAGDRPAEQTGARVGADGHRGGAAADPVLPG